MYEIKTEPLPSNPKPSARGGGYRKFDWQSMEIGNWIHAPDKNVRQLSSALHQAIATQRKMLGKRFRCETVYNEDGTKNGARVIRVE